MPHEAGQLAACANNKANALPAGGQLQVAVQAGYASCIVYLKTRPLGSQCAPQVWGAPLPHIGRLASDVATSRHCCTGKACAACAEPRQVSRSSKLGQEHPRTLTQRQLSPVNRPLRPDKPHKTTSCSRLRCNSPCIHHQSNTGNISPQHLQQPQEAAAAKRCTVRSCTRCTTLTPASATAITSERPESASNSSAQLRTLRTAALHPLRTTSNKIPCVMQQLGTISQSTPANYPQHSNRFNTLGSAAASAGVGWVVCWLHVGALHGAHVHVCWSHIHVPPQPLVGRDGGSLHTCKRSMVRMRNKV